MSFLVSIDFNKTTATRFIWTVRTCSKYPLPKTQIKQNKIEFQQNTLLLSYLTYTHVHGHISPLSCTAYGMAHSTWPIAATYVGPGGGAARRRLRGRPPGRPRKASGPINVATSGLGNLVISTPLKKSINDVLPT